MVKKKYIWIDLMGPMKVLDPKGGCSTCRYKKTYQVKVGDHYEYRGKEHWKCKFLFGKKLCSMANGMKMYKQIKRKREW